MIWPTFWFMGEDVLLHSGKPERPRHTAHTGEQIRLVNAVQSKQPGQRVAGNPTPARDSSNFLLCCWNNFLYQESQIIVRTASVQGSAFLKAGGLSQGTISWFQSRLLMATRVNGGQPAACATSYIF